MNLIDSLWKCQRFSIWVSKNKCWINHYQMATLLQHCFCREQNGWTQSSSEGRSDGEWWRFLSEKEIFPLKLPDQSSGKLYRIIRHMEANLISRSDLTWSIKFNLAKLIQYVKWTRNTEQQKPWEKLWDGAGRRGWGGGGGGGDLDLKVK